MLTNMDFQVGLSFTTYRFIEKPFMNKTKNKTTSNF